jgi:hypothetical protein
MLIRSEDFKDISKLPPSSHKKIWFICDSCKNGILQAYRNYLNQTEGKFCRTCRNIHSSNKPEVKEKQSIASKKMWQAKEYREHMSLILSDACKKAWDNNLIRHKWISENNPMKNEEIRNKISDSESTSKEEMIEICKSCGYEFIDRILGKRGGSRIKYKCTNGHIQEKSIQSFKLGIIGCNECRTDIIRSIAEKEIFDFIEEEYTKSEKNNRIIISPLELDIVMPEKKLAIEYCGLYWHSEYAGKDKNYHLNKLNLCNQAGYRLITIFEDEWIKKQTIVKNRLRHIIGLETERIYARKCIVKEIEYKQAKEFIDKYHIQGSTQNNISLGAFYENDELVAVMTFSKPSLAKGRKDQQSEGIFELSRFCTAKNVIGIAGKLLEYFKRSYEWKEIYSFADRRWSEGNLYERLGMEKIGITKPNYFYWKGNDFKRYHRFYFRKNVLEKRLEIFDSNKTEYQNMVDNGWNRIWDCGNIKYNINNDDDLL